jgi:hypothetical protein
VRFVQCQPAADMDEMSRFSGVHWRARSWLGALALLCGLAGGLVHSGSAAADPVPLWSDPITTSAWAAYGVGGREATYVNEHQGGMLDTERVIGPDGAVEYQAETGNTTITPPALAADGSGYVLRGGGAAGVIDAIDTTGKVRWGYTVPAEDTVRALLAGSDGAAYVLVSDAIDEEVLRLSAVDGSVTFDTPLPYGDYSEGYLFAEPSGVAAISGTHVIFLSQAGQITADVPAFPGGSATVFTSNNAGDVFVGAASVVGSEVNLTNGLSVSKVDPSGQVDWTTQTPATGEESGSMALAALPDGGVAYEVAGQSLGVLNADGTTRWNTKNPLGYGAMLADSSDHIDFERAVSNESCSDAAANCDGFAVEQLEASNGQVQHSLSFVYTDNDPSQFWFCGGFALGPSLFYVLDRLSFGDDETCSDGLTQPQLQAFALPGTIGPYPSPPATTIPPVTGPTGGGPGGSGGSSGNSSMPPPAPIYPCTPVHASMAKMLLASLKCSLLNAVSFAECGYGVAQYLALPFDAAKTARGLYDLRKVGKEVRPFAKAANDILKARFRKGAIPGFRTGTQIVKRLKQSKTAAKIIEILPDIAKSISTKDLEKFINDLVKIAGLKPCVDGIVNDIES